MHEAWMLTHDGSKDTVSCNGVPFWHLILINSKCGQKYTLFSIPTHQTVRYGKLLHNTVSFNFEIY